MVAKKVSKKSNGPKIKTKGHKGTMANKPISEVKKMTKSRPSNKSHA